MGRQEAVLPDRGRGERELGDLAPDQAEVRGLLGVLAEDLAEAGVVDAVIVVVTAMDIQARLGDGPGANVEHIGQALADRRVERLVHEGDALGRGEVHRPQTRHGHARGHRRRGVLGLGLDEDQRMTGDIDMAVGRLLGPVLAHLGRRGDGIGAGRVGGLPLAHDHRGVTVHRHARAGILHLFRLVFLSEHGPSLDSVHSRELSVGQRGLNRPRAAPPCGSPCAHPGP